MAFFWFKNFRNPAKMNRTPGKTHLLSLNHINVPFKVVLIEYYTDENFQNIYTPIFNGNTKEIVLNSSVSKFSLDCFDDLVLSIDTIIRGFKKEDCDIMNIKFCMVKVMVKICMLVIARKEKNGTKTKT